MFNDGHVAIYKANNKKTGTAAQFKISREKRCMFLEMAKQYDTKKFDWEHKIVAKLDETDISKILSLVNDTWVAPSRQSKPGLELYHENARGNKIINIAKQTNPNYPGYYMVVSASEGDKKDRIGIPISPDEVEYLKVGLSRALEVILGW